MERMVCGGKSQAKLGTESEGICIPLSSGSWKPLRV